MPTISLYIKNEDYAAWLAIENRSEWIHLALSENSVNTVIDRAVESDALSNVKREKSCCKSKQCEHWQWDMDKGLSVNVLSGREVEA